MPRVLLGIGFVMLSAAGVLGVACAKANLPDDDDIPLPDREIIDSSVPDVPMVTVDAADAADASDGAYGVFVTSMQNTANLGGVMGADTICQAHAADAGLPGTWAAWLSTGDGVTAIGRVGSGPWLLRTGDLVAASPTELSSGTLQHAIDHDEHGTEVASSKVWTGSSVDGVYSTNDCDEWTTGMLGRVGVTSGTDGTWTSAAVDSCANSRRLYCFQK